MSDRYAVDEVVEPGAVIFLPNRNGFEYRRSPDDAEMYEQNARERRALFTDNGIVVTKMHAIQQRCYAAGYPRVEPKVRAVKEPKAKREPLVIFK